MPSLNPILNNSDEEPILYCTTNLKGTGVNSDWNEETIKVLQEQRTSIYHDHPSKNQRF